MSTTTSEPVGPTTEHTEPATTASPIDRHAAPTADTKGRSGKATAALGGLAIALSVALFVVGMVSAS
jgi:hypothetical protein